MNFKLSVVIFVSLLLCGCSSTQGILVPNKAKRQKITYKQDNPTITSVKRNLVRLIVPQTVKDNSRTKAFVQVVNLSGKSFEFSPENITVVCTKNGLETPRHVYTYREAQKEISDAANKATIGAIIGGIGNSIAASSAGNTYSSGSFSGNSFSSNGVSTSYSGNVYGRSYNPGLARLAQQQAQDKTDRDLTNIAQVSNAAIAKLSKTMLRLNTVAPRKMCGGTIAFDGPFVTDMTESITFYVVAGKETHKFTFRIEKIE